MKPQASRLDCPERSWQLMPTNFLMFVGTDLIGNKFGRQIDREVYLDNWG